jgi:hypothetical protein
VQFYKRGGPVSKAKPVCGKSSPMLREVIPDVRFTDRIEVVTRDARAVSSVTSNTPAEKDGITLHQNYAPSKPCNINGLIWVQNSRIMHQWTL